MSKTFCSAPWMTMHVWPNNNVYPCCVSDSQKPFGKLDETGIAIMNNDQFKQFRIDILSGNKVDVCKNCYAAEDAGQESIRQSYNSQYQYQVQHLIDTTEEDGTAEVNLLHWDFRSSNICNFACRTCGPELSSTYKQIINRVNGIKGEKVLYIDSASRVGLDNIIDSNIKTVQSIYFAGGEPLMMDEHASIIEKLLINNRKDVKLFYSTNGSRTGYKGTEFAEIWKDMKEVTLSFSIDEIEERAEYWRYGTNWCNVVSNISDMVDISKKHPNVRVWFSPTVSVFNITRLKEIHKYFRDEGWLDVEQPNILFNPLHTQEYFCVSNTSTSYKEYAMGKLDDYCEWLSSSVHAFDKAQIPRVEGLKAFLLKNGVDMKDEFTINTKKMDEQRNENIFDVAPELADLLINKSIYDKPSTA